MGAGGLLRSLCHEGDGRLSRGSGRGREQRAQVTVTKEMELPELGDQLLIFGCGSPVAWMTELAWAASEQPCPSGSWEGERRDAKSWWITGLQGA